MSENIPQSGQGQPQHPQGYGNDGYQNPNPAQPYGNPNMNQSVPPQEQGGQYQQDPNQFGNPVPGAPNQQIPQPNGFNPQNPAQPQGDPHAGFAQPAAPAAPNPFAEALKNVWGSFLDVFKSQPGDAHKRLQDSQPWGWIIAVAAQSFAGSLVITQLVSGLLGLFYMFRGSFYGSRGSSSQGGNFGQTVMIFLIFFVAIFAIHVLRGLQLMLTARIGKVQSSFNDCMSAAGVAALPLVGSYLLLYLFVLLTMGTNGKNFVENPTLTIYLLVAIFAFSIVIGESLIYLGLNRLGRFEKSPVLMHALLTTAWVIVAIIVYNIAFQMMPNPMASSL